MKTGDYGNEPLFAYRRIFSACLRRGLASDQDDATDTAFKRRRHSMEMQQVGFDHDDLRARPRRSSCVVQLRSRYTLRPHPLMSHVKSRGMTKGFLQELRRSVSGDDRARVEAEPRDVGQQALIRGFTHVRRFVWGCPGLRSDVDLAIGHTG